MSNIHILNLSEYTSPDVTEIKHKGWVEYRVKNNRDYNYPTGYYQYLLDRAKGSVTNGGIIGGFSKFIYGEGLMSLDASRKPDEWAKLVSLVKPGDLKKVISDRKKLMMSAFQVTKNKGKVVSVTHFPVKTLLPEIMNEDGDIENWYYHPNWKDRRGSDEPTKIPSYGFGGKSGNEIYVIKGYNGNSDYFGEDDGYIACLPYAVLEEEIGDYQVNDVLNHFSGTKIINFNNGVIPDEEKQEQLANKVKAKLTGSRGDKVIVSFNSDETKKTTVEDVPLTNAPEHYTYLSEECERKILAGHRAPSELLGFNKESQGFSNNAEELKNKFKAFENFEVQSYQMEIIDALDEILADEGYSIRLAFKSLTPFDFVDQAEEQPEQTALSSEINLDEEDALIILENLKGETFGDEWVLTDKRECSDDNEPIEEWAKRLIKPKQSLLSRIIKSNPSGESSLDKDIYKVRYEYNEKYSGGLSRGFCRAMMARTENGVVYRKEDIDQASFQGVNKSHGHKGQPYSLFKYKGGVNCGHVWVENLYRLKTKTDGTPYDDNALSSSEEVDSIPYTPKVDERHKIAPKDMPRNGHHPNYKG